MSVAVWRQWCFLPDNDGECDRAFLVNASKRKRPERHQSAEETDKSHELTGLSVLNQF